jgi:putative peptide zinc metalloprotease protein
VAFSAQDLGRASALERLTMGGLLGGGFLVAVALAWQAAPGSFPETLWAAGPAFAGGLALALLAPTVVSFATTPFAPSWFLFFLALVLNLARSSLEMSAFQAGGLDLGIALLLAEGAALFLLAQRNLQYQPTAWVGERALGAHPRLRQAFGQFFHSLFTLFGDTFGRRKAQVLDDRLDVVAVTANWPVAVDGGRVVEGAEIENIPLEELAAQYSDLLERAVEIMDDLAGRPFLRRAMQAAYDGLPWAEREALARRVLSLTPWAEVVSRTFLSRRDKDLRLLAGVPLFFGCDETMLTELRAALRDKRVTPGQIIARQGQVAAGLYIVTAGEVEAWQVDETGREHLIEELRRGATFGEGALLGGKEYRATYRASVDTTLLHVEGGGLEWVAGVQDVPSVQMRTRARLLSWLAGIHLFEGLPWQDLQRMAVRLRRLQVPAWEVLIREGEPTDGFYLIEEGQVLAVTAWGKPEEEIGAEVGPGEFFGETSPLLGAGATVTMLTVEPCTLWTLPTAEYRRILEHCLTGVSSGESGA